MTAENINGWTSYNDYSNQYLRNNLDTLKLVEPALYQYLIAYIKQLEKIEIQLIGDSPEKARDVEGNTWSLKPPTDLLSVLQTKLNTLKQQKIPLIALAGSGYGPELALMQELAQILPETIVLVIERDPLSILLAFSISDQRRLLLSGIITWSVGEPMLDTLTKVITDNALFFVFGNNIEMVFGSTAQDQSVRQEYAQAFQQSIQEVAEWCKDMNTLVTRFTGNLNQRSEKLSHVWSSGSPTEYTTSPILRAIHRGLAEFDIQNTFTELPRGRSRRLVEYYGLMKANPDSILVLNDPTKCYVPSGAFHRITWVTDDPTFRKNYQLAPRYDADELVLYADQTYKQELIKQGAQRLEHFPVFALLESKGEYKEELAFPLVFVGVTWNMTPFLNSLKTEDRDLLEETYAEGLQLKAGTSGLKSLWSQRDIPTSLLDCAARFYEKCGRRHQEASETMAYVVYMLDIYHRRWNMAQALLPLGLHVYGNNDWKPLLGDQYADRYHGFIPYHQLADLYRSSKVVIGIHSLQLPTAINIRDCDVLMAGGCLLSDPVDGMSEDTIHAGRDCETAQTAEEFIEKAALLLEDEDRRNELSQNGRETIQDRYLPHHRAKIIVDVFQ